MAKRARSSNTKPLPTMEDEFEIPAEVEVAANECKKSAVSKGKANARYKAAKEALIEAMREHGIERVRIEVGNGNEKWLVLKEQDVIREETIKHKPNDNDDE